MSAFVSLDARTATVHIMLVHTDHNGVLVADRLCETRQCVREWCGRRIDGPAVDEIVRLGGIDHGGSVCAVCRARWVDHQQARPDLPEDPVLTGRWFTRHIGRVTGVIDLSSGDDPYLWVEGACNWVARISMACGDCVTLAVYHVGRLQRWQGTTDGVEGRVCPDCLTAEAARCAAEKPSAPSLLDLLEVG